MTASTLIQSGAVSFSPAVYTRPPVAVAEDSTVLAWRRRSTKTNPVPEAESYRALIVETSTLRVPSDACSSKFSRLLRATIQTLAVEMFTAWATDNIQKPAYDGPAINVDSVLSRWAEEKARETITGANVSEWLTASATFAALSPVQRKAWLAIFPKLAAPSYRAVLKPEQAIVALSRFVDSDMESTIGAFLVQRLHNISSEVNEAAEAL